MKEDEEREVGVEVVPYFIIGALVIFFTRYQLFSDDGSRIA